MTREDVYKVIDGERAYQDKKWGGKYHDEEHGVNDWLVYMQNYMNQAMKESTSDNVNAALEAMRKVVALGVACFEAVSVPERK